MTDLAGFRTKIRDILGDSGSARYANAVVDESLRWALAKYGDAVPQIKNGTITVSSAGREQSLSSLTGLTNILEVNFPFTTGDDTPTIYYPWYLFQYGGTWYMQLNGDKVPAVGDKIRVVYTAGQEIKDLDSASATTTMETHDSIIASGAAGKAAEMRASELVEAYGKKASEPERLARWAGQVLAQFDMKLLQLKVSQSFPGQSPDGWPLDKWDV